MIAGGSRSESGLPNIDGRTAAQIRRGLLGWFDRHGRDLPWRRTADPYAIWLSEMMLQQTQVATVIPYYERFTARFPTVRRLAHADLDDVLRLWAGLGYYARARNLHLAAQTVVREFGGRFPSTVEQLAGLPGIGAYTAGAISSIAFGKRAAVVDGNVARVLARLFEIRTDVRQPPGRDVVWRIAERLLPQKRCGDYNQALMELGATVCLPKQAANCPACPLKSLCGALAGGTVVELPIKTRKTVVKNETHVVAAIRRGDKWLVVKRPDKGLWAGLWEFPTVVSSGQSTAGLARKLARGLVGEQVSIRREPFCDLRHRLTHREIRFVGHACTLKPSRIGVRSKGKRVDVADSACRTVNWLDTKRIERIGISTAMRRVLAALKTNERAGNGTKSKTA